MSLYVIFLQGFGSNNHSEWPLWIRTFIILSHLFIVLNSSCNFFIYLIKLQIMQRKLGHWCRGGSTGVASRAATPATGESLLQNANRSRENSRFNRRQESIMMLELQNPLDHQRIPDIIQTTADIIPHRVRVQRY